jgi:hypothetical protein
MRRKFFFLSFSSTLQISKLCTNEKDVDVKEIFRNHFDIFFAIFTRNFKRFFGLLIFPREIEFCGSPYFESTVSFAVEFVCSNDVASTIRKLKQISGYLLVKF